MKRTRAYRRHQTERVKNKTRRHLKNIDWPITDKIIGIWTSTHRKPCSCSMCGNPRRVLKGQDYRTLNEKRFEDSYREQLL